MTTRTKRQSDRKDRASCVCVCLCYAHAGRAYLIRAFSMYLFIVCSSQSTKALIAIKVSLVYVEKFNCTTRLPAPYANGGGDFVCAFVRVLTTGPYPPRTSTWMLLPFAVHKSRKQSTQWSINKFARKCIEYMRLWILNSSWTTRDQTLNNSTHEKKCLIIIRPHEKLLSSDIVVEWDFFWCVCSASLSRISTAAFEYCRPLI